MTPSVSVKWDWSSRAASALAHRQGESMRRARLRHSGLEPESSQPKSLG